MVFHAAIIGFGSVAQHGHLPWYLTATSTKLTAIVEPTLDGRREAATLLPNLPVFESLERLLATQRVNFVDITAPPAAHAQLAITALNAGAHVFCEKPITTSWQSLRHVAAARRRSGATIASCHNWYFAPAIRRALAVIDAGLIGEPRAVFCVAHRTQPAAGARHWNPLWRQSTSSGGGIIADLGYHLMYLVSQIFRRAPLEVRARTVRTFSDWDDAEREATVELNYGAGMCAELQLSWLRDVRETTLRVLGSYGDVVISGETIHVSPTGRTQFEEHFDPLTADSWHAGWTSQALDQFVRVLSTGDDDACWSDIVRSVATLDAAHRSLHTGVAVALPPLSLAADDLPLSKTRALMRCPSEATR